MTRMAGVQLRVLNFALLPMFAMMGVLYGWADCAVTFALTTVAIELVAIWCDFRASE